MRVAHYALAAAVVLLAHASASACSGGSSTSAPAPAHATSAPAASGSMSATAESAQEYLNAVALAGFGRQDVTSAQGQQDMLGIAARTCDDLAPDPNRYDFLVYAAQDKGWPAATLYQAQVQVDNAILYACPEFAYVIPQNAP